MKAKEKLLLAVAGLLAMASMSWLSAGEAEAAGEAEEVVLLPVLQRALVQPPSPVASTLLLPGLHKSP